ncbi:ubiquitin-protein ligase RMD5 SCDLUD_001960 [Saccharomycodes ludwigii]|uniref:ubiquitin-protein ligase RMD5 n=1 Tax=Saccharomycodes ludwigii TaxID=36035 RepID=UPI001E829375|nr:hypothetical protein SCDLUD_001960 [Saccharomycodes ludwigii]KAH3902147.1 hypothetical protein SCDLUD_001960 [Saccharomycodes ludwigii]
MTERKASVSSNNNNSNLKLSPLDALDEKLKLLENIVIPDLGELNNEVDDFKVHFKKIQAHLKKTIDTTDDADENYEKKKKSIQNNLAKHWKKWNDEVSTKFETEIESSHKRFYKKWYFHIVERPNGLDTISIEGCNYETNSELSATAIHLLRSGGTSINYFNFGLDDLQYKKYLKLHTICEEIKQGDLSQAFNYVPSNDYTFQLNLLMLKAKNLLCVKNQEFESYKLLLDSFTDNSFIRDPYFEKASKFLTRASLGMENNQTGPKINRTSALKRGGGEGEEDEGEEEEEEGEDNDDDNDSDDLDSQLCKLLMEFEKNYCKKEHLPSISPLLQCVYSGILGILTLVEKNKRTNKVLNRRKSSFASRSNKPHVLNPLDVPFVNTASGSVIEESLNDNIINWYEDDEMECTIPLPPELSRFHPCFICPVLKIETDNITNPPYLLSCRHVVSKESLNNISQGNFVKCPYCMQNSTSYDLRKITFVQL